ncbi:MAG TPA: YlbF family regulator [Longimicrobiales bacterium]|nr:YlbF family regulator [Longimicrobiales bacterium]
MLDEIMTGKAKELGRLLGQSSEYQALGRARQRLSEDREAVEAMNQLSRLESEVAMALQQGQEPPEATRIEYETAFTILQSLPSYQGLVAAQSNFDKLLAKVNEEIGKGMESGAQSRIILPS